MVPFQGRPWKCRLAESIRVPQALAEELNKLTLLRVIKGGVDLRVVWTISQNRPAKPLRHVEWLTDHCGATGENGGTFVNVDLRTCAGHRDCPMIQKLKSAVHRQAAFINVGSILLLLIGLMLLLRALPADQLLEYAKNWIGELGMWGPLALGMIYIVATLLFIPGWILTVTAGAVYGLVTGTVIVSLASTTAAAFAFLIARHLARGRARRRIEQSPKLTAIDEAIGAQGWKIVALLRLSPAVPFSLQNYLYGVTAVRFWPYVLTSWVSMLPGTFLYVYLGSMGAAATQKSNGASAGEWTLRVVGLLATIAVTVYVTRLARRAIRAKTAIQEKSSGGTTAGSSRPAENAKWPRKALAMAATAIVTLALGVWAQIYRDAVHEAVAGVLNLPPMVHSRE